MFYFKPLNNGKNNTILFMVQFSYVLLIFMIYFKLLNHGMNIKI